MKATIIGTDLLQHGDSVKILEIDTNPIIHNHGAELLDYDSLFTMLTDNHIAEFHFIFTAFDGYDETPISEFVNQIVKYCNDYNIKYIPHPVLDKSVPLPKIQDTRSKFILRCAYDDHALMDSSYCSDKYEFTCLMEGSEYIPNTFFHSDSLSYNSLNTIDINDSIFPNLIEKGRFDDDNKSLPILSKYTEESQLIEKKSNLKKDSLLQEFVLDVENILDNHWTVIRSFDIIYGTNLNTINIGGYREYCHYPLSFCENTFEQNTIDLNIPSKHRFLNKVPPKIQKII